MPFAMTTPNLSWTVKDVMRCYPISMLIFNKLGIDTCCGATATLEMAAHKVGLAPDDLLTALLSCTVDDDDVPPLRDHHSASCERTEVR